jgi:ABC-type Na+ transport system ATPase subunit NatA
MGEVETVCDRVAIVSSGDLKAVGRVEQVMQGHPNLEKAFLNIIGYQN